VAILLNPVCLFLVKMGGRVSEQRINFCVSSETTIETEGAYHQQHKGDLLS
jgi:hypothetical protein